jgi:predicted DNA-binding protein
MKKPKQSNAKLTVFCRVSPEVRKRLDEISTQERRTISQIVLFSLEKFIGDYRGDAK